MKTKRSFISIGAGNVASHLCQGLCDKGFILKQVFSRTEEAALALSRIHGSGMTTKILDVSPEADFYLVSVTDLALPSVLKDMKVTGKLVFHTAGTFGLDVFHNRFRNCGVLYPLQTFTKNRHMNLGTVPFLVEGSDPETIKELLSIGNELSEMVLEAGMEKRKWYHLAAVFAANFTNHMYTVASELLSQQDLDFSLLYPIMEETLSKARSSKPWKGQTGPAVRGDTNTMERHLNLMAAHPDLRKLYTFISMNIHDFHKAMKLKDDGNDQF